MVERRKLPWGLLLSLFVLLMVTAYYLSGLAKTGRGNIGKLAESVCLHLVASIAELVE